MRAVKGIERIATAAIHHSWTSERQLYRAVICWSVQPANTLPDELGGAGCSLSSRVAGHWSQVNLAKDPFVP